MSQKSGLKSNWNLMDEYLQDPDIAALQSPDKLDFCWVVSVTDQSFLNAFSRVDHINIENPAGGFPLRPRPLSEAEIDLAKCHVAKLEHCESIYRLYDYELGEPRGVFRGEHQQLVVESIPKEDEYDKLIGLLIYNKQAYEAAKRDHKNYWEWVEKRNKARWITQERGEIDYDAKNMMHCMRLMISGMHILEHGRPIVRFEGADRELLMDIRHGKFEYDELMKMMTDYEARLKAMGEKSDLPNQANSKKANALYRRIVESYG